MPTIKRKPCWMIFILSGFLLSQNVSSGQNEWRVVLDNLCIGNKTVTIPSGKLGDYIPMENQGITKVIGNMQYTYEGRSGTFCHILNLQTNQCVEVPVKYSSPWTLLSPGTRVDNIDPIWCAGTYK